MEGFVFSSSGWAKNVCVCIALFWVAYRVYQVLSKPVDELVGLLGLEVPVAPIVSLAGIKADGILLHWKPPDQRSSVLKYLVRVNGIDIGGVSPQEASVTITDLLPDHHYVVRIVTLNSANFQAPSVPLRFKTLPTSSGQFFSNQHKDEHDGPEDKGSNPAPVIRPCKAFVDSCLPPPTPPPMAREHSNSQSRARRIEPGRRSSPASHTVDQVFPAQEATDSEVSIQQLTEKLEGLRRDIEDVERQIVDEEEDFQNTKISLIQKRDEKKQALKEREDASRDLRKEVVSLERTNASAQAKKATQEKLLHQKENERKKMKDDIERWKHQMREMQADVERIEEEKVEYLDLLETKVQEMKSKHAEELLKNKHLEEVIHEKGIQIKVLEEERKNLEDGEEGNNQTLSEVAAQEEDRRWALNLSQLQQRYATAWQILSEAERTNIEAHRRLLYLEQRRASQPQLFPSMPIQDGLPGRRNSQRRRTTSIRNENISSGAPGGFILSTAPPFNSSISSISPTFTTPTPYFNINNGMALPSAINLTSFSPAEVDALTGGAPMSPTAGALLPSGLFGDDTDRTDAEDEGGASDSGSALAPPGARGGLGKLQLPGLGAPQTLEPLLRSPSSPVSVQSRSPSVFASPRDSNSHLSFYAAAENLVDSDRRSIRSTSSSLLAATGGNPPSTRFGNLFGLNRQRGKTISDQGPPLGTLKGSQSHSMPRQDLGELDPIGTQRRRGSYSGAWFEAFTRKTAPAESQNSPKHVATRRRAFNMFGSKGDPWLSTGLDRPSSPRQGSTKSTDTNLLPRPSTESQQRFGWPIDGFGQRNSPLGADWSIANTTSWSRHPSRRPSIQYGSTASLVHDTMLLNDTEEFSTLTRSPTQAPIGTRPQSSASQMPPPGPVPPTPPKQLNPTAPNFKSIFIRDKKADKNDKATDKEAKKEEKKAKSEKSDKSSRKEKDKAMASETAATDSGKDTSSLNPRRSRDNRSISTTAESTSSPRESLERLISQTGSESQTPSNVIGKESFMQKLSRKSSSGKFFPAFGKEKGSLFSKKTCEVGTPDETDEDGTGSSGVLAKSMDSVTGSPSFGTGFGKDNRSSGLSWSSLKRMGKRGDKTPSLHESITSDTTGDEEDGVLQVNSEGIVGPA